MYKGKNNAVNFLLKNSEYFLSFGSVIAGIFLICFSLYRPNFNYFCFGFFLLLCLLVYFIIKKHNIVQNETRSYSTKVNKVNDISFLLLYIIGIITLYLYHIPYERPIGFFLVFICMLILVLIQIVLGDSNYFKILSKIIFLALFYALTQALLFKSLMSVDSFTHMFWTDIILRTGYIPQLEIFYSYLFHILHAQIQMITGLNYNYSNLLFALPSMIICIVCNIFIIGRKLVTAQVGLMSCFVLICSTAFIIFSVNLIPNSYSSVFLIMALSVLVTGYELNIDIRYTTLLFFLIILVTITHPLTNLILLIVLTVYLLFINVKSNIFLKLRVQDIFLLTFMIILTLGWWIYSIDLFYCSIDFVLSGMDFFESADKSADLLEPIYERFVLKLDIIESFHLHISYFIFWIIGFPGCLYLIRNFKNNKGFAFSFSGLSIFTLFSLIVITGREFINIRFYYLISLIFCIFTAIFIILVFQSTKKPILKAATVLIIISVCIMCITHPLANITNPIYGKPVGPQAYPFESELSMISTLRTSGSPSLASDRTFEYFERVSGRADITDIFATLKILDFSNAQDYTIILRDSIFKEGYGKEISYPQKDLILYSLAVNRISKIFDVGPACSFSY